MEHIATDNPEWLRSTPPQTSSSPNVGRWPTNSEPEPEAKAENADASEMLRYCGIALRELARAYPSHSATILSDLKETAKTWARAFTRASVPWQSILGLCFDARDTLRHAGRTSFPPTVEDVLLEWNREQERAGQEQSAREWQEHDDRQRAHGFATEIPAISVLHMKRGAAVACRCTKNNIEDSARLDEDAEFWICGGLRSRDCGFWWPTSDTLNAPLPKSKSSDLMAGFAMPQAVRADPVAAPLMDDDELLESLQKHCGLNPSEVSMEDALAFGNWLIVRVPVRKWSYEVAAERWVAWKQERSTAP